MINNGVKALGPVQMENFTGVGSGFAEQISASLAWGQMKPFTPSVM